jgi:hypothetical protein
MLARAIPGLSESRLDPARDGHEHDEKKQDHIRNGCFVAAHVVDSADSG